MASLNLGLGLKVLDLKLGLTKVLTETLKLKFVCQKALGAAK